MASGFPIILAGRRAAWTPSQISTDLWLDAADANTITLNGSTVSQWSDKSGNGRNATQATAASQPAYAKAQNFLFNSEQIGGFGWGLVAATVSADQIVAPDGTLTADKIQETASNFFHMARQIFPCAASTQYTMSAYFKKAERDIVFLNPFLAGVGGVTVWANLTTGTVAATSASVWTINSTAVTAVGNDWYRVSITFTTTAAAGDCIADFGLSTAANVSQYQGVVGNGAYLWGAQVQQGVLSVYQKTEATNQPLLAGINGIPTLAFDGINDTLNYDGTFLANTNYTVTAVQFRSNPKIQNWFLGGTTLAANQNFLMGYENPNTKFRWGQFENDVDTFVDPFVAGNPSIAIARQSNTEGKSTFINGAAGGVSANTDNLLSNAGTLIGTLATGYFDGSMAEIVMTTSAMSPNDRQKLEGYLAWKWGLQANLPSNHPYKLLPPTV